MLSKLRPWQRWATDVSENNTPLFCQDETPEKIVLYVCLRYGQTKHNQPLIWDRFDCWSHAQVLLSELSLIQLEASRLFSGVHRYILYVNPLLLSVIYALSVFTRSPFFVTEMQGFDTTMSSEGTNSSEVPTISSSLC